MRFFYIIPLILGAAFVVPDFAFAADLPAQCPGTIEEYVSPKDFIVVEDGNSVNVDGKNGEDCILVGNNNTAEISGGGQKDVIIIGNGNQGKIMGGTADDIIIVGNSNNGEVDGGEGQDALEVGDNNLGNISGGTGIDTVTIGDDNIGDIDLGGGNDSLQIGKRNVGNIKGGTGDDTLIKGCGNLGIINGEGGINIIKTIPCLPVSDILPGTYTSIQSVFLTSEDSENIYYTTNGTTPVCSPVSGTLYGSLISVAETKTITAIGCSEDDLASDIATFTYTIELKTDSASLPSILEAVFVPDPGASISLTFTLTVSQDLEINTTASGSKIVLDEATVITRADGLELNAVSLSSSETDIGLLTGLAAGQVFKGALQWGVPSITLNFSTPIIINIFVGTDLDGQTLNVVRSATGIDGWTDDGIVPPATCTVSVGICSFQATKASYYAALINTPVSALAPISNSGGGGGGGTIWFPALYNPVSTTTSVPETISTPAPALTPQITPATTPVVVVLASQKPIVTKVVAPKVIAKIQPTLEPIRSLEVEKPKPVNKNILSNILAIIVDLFRWPL